MSKSSLFYALAFMIAVAFLLSIATGLVSLQLHSGQSWLDGSSRYQGERNGGSQSTALGLSHRTWDDLHTWFSVVMAAGALSHLLLHWSWLVRMTRRLLRPGREGKSVRSGKAKLFYAIDIFIGLTFILSMLTGLVFLFLGSGGYQGGRNPSFQTAFLGLNRGIWSDLHTWFGLMMAAGVLTHLALHWRWLVSKSKQLLRPHPSGRLATQLLGESDGL